jgi:transcriptional regulator with XRE-family HTH domain
VPTALACPACRTGMLARRGDPLCPTCAKAAREMAIQPLWVFDSLLLRQALAQVNLAAVPAIVRAACGLSQRDLAAIVGWNPATLSYYERGQRDGMFDIRTVLQFADAVGMPRGALLPLVFTNVVVRQMADTEYELSAKLSRRGPDNLSAAASPPVTVPQTASGSHARYWRACTDVLYIRDRAVGGTALLPSALQQWQRVAPAVQGTNAGEPDPLFLAAAGELALCTGWIALDAERLTLAQPLYEKARELAVSAGDVMLAVQVLTSQSMLHAEMARTAPGREPARQALRLAYQAADEGRYLPMPSLHALIALRHASAASLLGDRAAFQSAIGQARRELDRGPRDGDPPQRLRFVSETEIITTEATGYLSLGDPDRSAMLYRQALASGMSSRDRASCGAGLADAQLRQGARQEAVATAMDVLTALEREVTSMRCLNRLRLIRQAAGDTVGAHAFRERFDAAEHALGATRNLPCGDTPLADNPGHRIRDPAGHPAPGRPLTAQRPGQGSDQQDRQEPTAVHHDMKLPCAAG